MGKRISDIFVERTGRHFLYNIMPLENIPSVMEHGILCYDAIKEMTHISVAMSEVQKRRDGIVIPETGRRLHSYANLYFTHNNPMLFKRQNQAEELCILAVKADILDIEGCIVTDQNAAANMVMFYDPEDGMDKISFDMVFAQYWVHEGDIYLTRRHKHIKCAEVLIPHCVPYDYVAGAYVVSEKIRSRLSEYGFMKQIVVNRKKFYQ